MDTWIRVAGSFVADETFGSVATSQNISLPAGFSSLRLIGTNVVIQTPSNASLNIVNSVALKDITANAYRECDARGSWTGLNPTHVYALIVHATAEGIGISSWRMVATLELGREEYAP